MTNSIENEKIKIDSWESKFDKNVYEKNVLEAIIEDKAKETEERLTKEREMIKSWNFELYRGNVANGNNERMELLNHFTFLKTESTDKSEEKFYEKVFKILEELAKNVQKDKYYMKDWEDEKYKKYELWEIKIISDDEKITITTSNYTKENVSRIPERLQELNNMDKWQIREEYKIKLDKSEMSEKWWAGLWFIDIIRKSWGSKLECTIEETDIPEMKKINFSISIQKDQIVKSKEAFAA